MFSIETRGWQWKLFQLFDTFWQKYRGICNI